MKRYRVQVGYQIFHVTDLFVEAENDDDAHAQAWHILKEGEPLEFEPDPYDEGGPLGILDCEELPDGAITKRFTCE